MNKPTIAPAIAVCAASLGLLTGAPAHADAADPQLRGQHLLGGPVQIGDSTWTVSDLKPSDDTIPYRPAGRLWEATATDEATNGSTTPIVSNFNARAHSGQSYRELFQVASSEGVNPSGLAQGQKVSGKLYFDVTGDAPDSVTYNAGGPDLGLWVQPPPSAGATGGAAAHTNTPAGSPTSSGAPANQPPPLPAARGGGSAGTVIPAPAQGTPAGTEPGPQAAAAGNPASAAGTPAPAPGAPAPTAPPPSPTPAPAAGQIPSPGPGTEGLVGDPAAGTPVPLVPGASGPASAGSQGTPLQPGSEPAPPSPAPQPALAPAANTQPSPTPAVPPAG